MKAHNISNYQDGWRVGFHPKWAILEGGEWMGAVINVFQGRIALRYLRLSVKLVVLSTELHNHRVVTTHAHFPKLRLHDSRIEDVVKVWKFKKEDTSGLQRPMYSRPA